MRYIHITAATLLCVLAYVMFNLGMDWINFGYGVHPAFAFTAVPLLVALAIAFMFTIPMTREQRIASNRWYITAGGPCHDREFWEREKDYL